MLFSSLHTWILTKDADGDTAAVTVTITVIDTDTNTAAAVAAQVKWYIVCGFRYFYMLPSNMHSYRVAQPSMRHKGGKMPTKERGERGEMQVGKVG